MQPSDIFNRENPQNPEPQNGPRRGLDFIALINRDTSLCDLCIYVVIFGQSFTYFSLYAQHAIQILNWLGLQSVIYESQFVKIN